MIFGPDGNLYGTTTGGLFTGGFGTVFRITTNGVFTSLALFQGTNGSDPEGSLAFGTDGNLYGTTSAGGTGGGGTIFRIVLATNNNNPPVLAAIANQTIVVATQLVITNRATDPDSPPQVLSFSLGNGAAANANIDPTSGVFSWTPTAAQVGTNAFRVIVTDNGQPSLSATQSFSVVVLPTNNPPVLAAIANQTITVGTQLVITNRATDPDSPPQVLSFSLGNGAAANATIDPASGVFSWTPTAAQVGTNAFRVVVSDNGLPSLSATQSFSVVVLPINTPPVLAAIANQTITVGTQLVITNRATDPDSPPQVLSFSLGNGAAANATIDPASGVFSWTPTAAQVGTNALRVIVTDNGQPSLSATQSFSVVVLHLYDGVDLTDPAQAEADTDGDGVTNLVEFALGTDPRNPGDGNAAMTSDLVTISGSRFLELQYKRRVDAAALQLQYMPEVSGDRINWVSDNAHVLGVSVTPVDSEFDLVTVRDTTPVSAGAPRFIRLRVVSSSSQSTSPFWIGTDTPIFGNGGSGAKITAFSQRMVGPVEYAGKITGLQPDTLIDTNAVWDDGQFGTNGALAYVEFDNGFRVDIVNTFGSAHSLVLADSLSGIASVGTAYRIRPHFTIAGIFGANNETGLKSGLNPAQADNIILQIPQTQQTLTIFYFDNGVNQGWFRADFSPAAEQIIYPEQGLIVRRIAFGDLSLHLSGPVKTGVTVVPVEPGYDLLGTLRSTSNLTLGQSNLHTGNSATGVASGLNPASADNVLVIQSNGSVTTYFYFDNFAGTQGWLDAAFNAADNVPIAAGSTFFILRKSPTGLFNWTIPAE
jgi:uncharacterized repeat protein (TIGR03803 family)